eukprot:1195147-Prorocentrum_minimum.AAC.4
MNDARHVCGMLLAAPVAAPACRRPSSGAHPRPNPGGGRLERRLLQVDSGCSGRERARACARGKRTKRVIPRLRYKPACTLHSVRR